MGERAVSPGPVAAPSATTRTKCIWEISASAAVSASTVNQVVGKRLVKKQQMCWSPRGAHPLLQVRTHILNDGLSDHFHRWYPAFVGTSTTQESAA